MSDKTHAKLKSAAEHAQRPRNTLHLSLGAVLIFFGVLTVFSGIRSLIDNKQRFIAPNGILTVELAKTEEQRAQGLMGRQTLAENVGMLFVFDGESAGCFWMKNTPLSLDIVWLDVDKKVVHVHKNATPNSEDRLCPKQAGAYVLEVKSGRADVLGLQVGAQTRF